MEKNVEIYLNRRILQTPYEGDFDPEEIRQWVIRVRGGIKNGDIISFSEFKPERAIRYCYVAVDGDIYPVLLTGETIGVFIEDVGRFISRIRNKKPSGI